MKVRAQAQVRSVEMDVTTIRIVAGIGAVIVLFIIIWRRRKKASQ